MSAPCIISSRAGVSVWHSSWPTATSWELGTRVKVWSKVENSRMDEVIDMWATQLAAIRELA